MLVIIGIGQSLRGDDAVGLSVVQMWQDTHPATAQKVRVELAENPGVGLLNLLEGAAYAVIVDAVQSNAAPGTVHSLQENELAAFVAGSDSAHGWGVAETLKLGRQLYPENLPDQINLIGIEVGQVDLGAGISPEVVAALPKCVALLQKKIGARLS